MADKKTVNIRQLSKIMQVSQVTLRDWVSKGMPAKRTDRGYLCNPDEVFKWREQYLAEKKQNSEGYGQARTERMIWLARQSQLNYERESGKLVDASEVRQAAFETARMTRDAILAVPDRVASLLAGEISASGKIDKTRVHEILGKELRQALENLSNNLNRPEGVNGKKIDLSELSEKMGVSRYLIEDWIQLGLPYERTSRGYRFNFDQVVEWHDSHVKRIIGTEGKDDKTTTK